MITSQFNERIKIAKDALDQKTKPPGSLGLLEDTAAQISAIQKTLTPDTQAAIAIVFAAVGEGTANFLQTPAMTSTQLNQALAIGQEATSRAFERGIKVIALGEMGIGNTTSAAAIVSAVCKADSTTTVGRGTGLDDAGVKHKINIVKQALEKHSTQTPEAILQNLGGFEIAAMCGAMLQAKEYPVAMVVDGYIATAAALCAVEIEPTVREHLLFAHRSVEPGHAIALQHLQATPLLQLDLRLGEGSGAALAIPLIRSATAILNDMATFESAGVERELA